MFLRNFNTLHHSYKKNRLKEPRIRPGFIEACMGIELTREDVLGILKTLKHDRREQKRTKDGNEERNRLQYRVKKENSQS